MNMIKKSLRAGFSLMEIVIAVAIIGIMMGVAVPLVVNSLAKSKLDSTKADVHGIKQSIDLFNVDTGSYPQELNDLVEKPSDERVAAKWAGPYIERLKSDNWNHDFQYERTAQGEHPYELYSFGPKGEDAPEEERISAWD